MPQFIAPGGARGPARQQPLTVQVIDVGRDPALKPALLSGRLTNLSAPFLYHDPAKQIAFVLMPMQLGMTDLEQQRIIGQLTQSVMRTLPEDAPRAYLLQPKTFFTFQSLIEAILEKDGITPEMLKEQQAKADLLRDLLRSTSEEDLRNKMRANDALIDATLFELLNASIEANLEMGRDEAAQQLAGLQQVMIEETTYGKKIGARLAVIEAFQKDPSRDNLIAQLIAAPDAETRESLVAAGRHLIDYLFFQTLTTRIESAEGDQKQRLIELRKEVQDIRDRLDAASRAIMQQKADLINTILSSEKPFEKAREHAEEIDELFMSLLQANIQQAQQRGDQELSRALGAVYQIALQIMAERQPPEVQIINALMSMKYPEETEQLLNQIKDQFDDRLILVMGQFAEELAKQDRTDLSAKLTQIMVQARSILPKYDPSRDKSSGPTVGAPTTPPAPPEPPKPKIEIARR
ncbi:MAG: hypothetical protein RMN25_12325 [Anaerolineae bacterium]|nr:CpXC domain-containing protein [Thermoflexales bacterium]MDW8408556.1 hypothetical protein [Anaerolineae bacterium]